MQTIVIKPTAEWKKDFTTYLDGKFQHDKLGLFNILSNGKVVTRENIDKEITKKIWFDNQNRSFSITFDETNNLKSAEVAAWAKHPQIEYPGNDNCKKPMFIMRNQGEEEKIEAIIIKKRGQVYNLVNNSTAEEMRDIAFVVGYNPVNKTIEDIFVNLLDFEDGLLMKDPDKFLNTFSTPDMQYIVMAKKALIYGVIIQEGNQFTLNNEIIGGSFEDVVAYLKMNERMYEDFVKPEVLKQDILSVNTDYALSVNSLIGLKRKEKQKKKEEIEEVSDNDKLTQLRKEAKKAKISHYWLMTEEKLEKAIKSQTGPKETVITDKTEAEPVPA